MDEASRRLGLIRVTEELLQVVLRLPPGVRFLGAGQNPGDGVFEFLVECPDFKEVPAGTTPPAYRPRYCREEVVKFSGWSDPWP